MSSTCRVFASARYRFHGSTPPAHGSRTPIRDTVDTPAVDETGTATLRIYDPIDSWGEDWGVSAKEFVAALDAIPNAQEIRLHLNSPGGEVFEAIAIVNSLRRHPATVTAVVDGLAASSASFIAASADRVIMGQNSQLMIHDPWGLCVGNAADMRDLAGRLDHMADNIASMYADKAGGDLQAWRSAMLAETWYSADEAVAAGLADEVSGTAAAPAAQNRFDLTQFAYQGRAAAPPPIPLPRLAAAVGTSDAAEFSARHQRNRHRALSARYSLPI